MFDQKVLVRIVRRIVARFFGRNEILFENRNQMEVLDLKTSAYLIMPSQLQVWQLLHNKQSLCYHIFKPRFFPNCSIMEAVESNFRSYAWKSILKGRDVLLRGAWWRIGNGAKVS